MKERVAKAIENHRQGCNCAQAVALAYTDLLAIDEEILYGMTEAFGSGIGGLREICGAVSAGVLVLSSQSSNDKLYEKLHRKATYEKAKTYVEAFGAIDGTHQCGELLKLRQEGKSSFPDCTACVKKAAELLEEFLREE